jgi:hypothetical protein
MVMSQNGKLFALLSRVQDVAAVRFGTAGDRSHFGSLLYDVVNPYRVSVMPVSRSVTQVSATRYTT